MTGRRDRPSRPWHLYVLAAIAVGIGVLAVTQIGPPTSSARSSREIVTAAQGVVQSTVSGSGNIAAGTDVNVNFNTGGTLQNVYVSVGQHVSEGQLLATLDPTSAQLSLDQANEQLTAAEDNLSCLQGVTSDCGSGGSGSGSAGSGSGSGSGTSGAGANGSASTTSYSAPAGGTVEYAAYHPGTSGTQGTPGTSGTSGTKPGNSGSKPGTSGTKSKPGSGKVVATKTTPSVTVTVVVPSTTRTGSGSSPSGASGSTPKTTSAPKTTSTPTTTTTTTPSPGSIASAQASVYSAQAAVHNAQIALNNTKLYAPTDGTVASMSSAAPGDTVSGGSTSNGSSGSSSSSSSSSGGAGGSAGAGTTAGSLGGSGSSGSGSSGSGFVEIVNTSSLTTTIAFSESDISKVHVGQPATVSLDALPGVQLAAHVSSISLVGTTSSSVVSYDATLTLDQTDSQVKPGMSASASVIVGQAEGVTVPNAAVSGSGSLGTVNVLKNGKSVPQQVVVGLRGDSRTQIISGVTSGEQLVVTVALPSLTSTPTTGSGVGGGLGGGRFGGGGLGGAGLGGLGGGGGVFFRGGGGG